MRITDPGVDTQLAQLSLTEDKSELDTLIVAFFDVDAAAPSTHEPDLGKRARQRIRDRIQESPPTMKK